MAKCPFYAQGQCDQGGAMTKHGLKIHMGKIHGVHHGDVVDIVATTSGASFPNGSANLAGRDEVTPALVPCGHPFCKVLLAPEELRAHWDSDHPTWLMHDGRYVFEV